MASAEVTEFKDIPQTQMVRVPVTIMLRLTEAEASTLLRLTAAVGGDPFKSRRRHTNAVQLALLNVGLRWAPEGTDGGTVKFLT